MNPGPGPEPGSRLLRDDRGSTTVTGAFITALVLALALAAIHAGAGLVEQRRAGIAADLAAVAGAVDAQRGGGGCDAAGQIAVANGSELAGCARDGEDVQVTVQRGERTAVARAGPVGEGGGAMQ
ncbi:Rv3654c family TadE-like protein [Corynebacterium xerosis]|uniref:Flp pilus-assembly TadE/G-like family protein n=1 Tax=Corynebacterium xerosis TaxID=1725 RepID=A0A7X9SW82_9CORY|nr:Rv3654c family TadE-like protein [Corynebacterium xerosis]NMF09012.1 flp pilus-assembly TadE/G-like family protein [Corynebacterium xerosis]SQB95366.1 Predicted membrane protein [Clostridium paraputrificum]